MYFICTHPFCKTCDNNKGGVCAYALDKEAEEKGLQLSDIIDNERCTFYDPAPTE